jgi:hypothetical protein
MERQPVRHSFVRRWKESKSKEKAAGECHVTQQMTRRPSPTAARGLHAIGKTRIMIQQTEQQNNVGGTHHVLEQKHSMESRHNIDDGDQPPGHR